MITIVEQFKQWQSALDDFQTNMKSDLAEIRQQKSEVLQIKKELLELLDQGNLSGMRIGLLFPLRRLSLGT